MPDGNGVAVLVNGSRYEGEFKIGLMSKGVFTYADGSRYEGEFKNGQCDGKGKMIYANGSFYKGEFKNNKFDGQGRKIFQDEEGNIVEQVGLWKAGEFQDSEKAGMKDQ